MTKKRCTEIQNYQAGDSNQKPQILGQQQDDEEGHETKQEEAIISIHKRRVLTRQAVRDLYTWAHYRFKMRLINKTRQYQHCKIVLCDEHYTSKTCGECGNLHHGLGGNKNFHCPDPECDAQMDRDFNAARNILLRYLTIHCGSGSCSSASSNPKSKRRRA